MRPSTAGAAPPQPLRLPAVHGVHGALLALALFAAGCTSSESPGPRPTAVLPDRGSLAAPVTIRIRGEAFEARVQTDFAGADAGGVSAGFRALLGTVALQDVALLGAGELAATVPAGLASGLHDLTVIDPWGRAGTLAGAYRVLPAGDGSASVAGYRIEPVGPQEAFRPFMAAITALDAAGAVVADFNGSVRVSDLTGTGVPGAAARFVGGRWTGLVEVRSAHAADVLTVVDAQGATGSSAPFAVAPPRPAVVRFSTPPASTTAGRCTGPITLALEDAFGVAARADRATPLAVAGSPAAGLTLHGDASCGTPAGALAVAAGESTVSVWLVATRAGTVELTATAAGLEGSAQQLTVAAGPPATLAFVTAPQAVNAGACSQVATVEVRDAHGNPSAPGALTLSLEVSPAGGLAFFADPTCTAAAPTLTLAAGATGTGFHFSGTIAQRVQLTVAASGLASATQDELVTPEGRATRLAFLTPPRGAAAGACSEEVTIQALDSHGDAVASPGAVQVSLAASPAAGFTTYADPACATPATVVQIGAGQSTGGFRFRGTLAASVAVTASASTLTPATQTESVGPAPPAQVAFTGAAQGAPAGSCSAAVGLRVVDRFGNASPVGAPLAVALSAAPPDGFGFHADPACQQPLTEVTVAAGASASGFHFLGTQAGPVVVTAAPSGLSGDSRTEQIRAAAAARLVFASAAQSIAAGACSSAVVLEIRDTQGNPAALPGTAMVALAATPSQGVTFHRDAACASPTAAVPVTAGGSGASFWFSASAAGQVTLRASAAGIDPAAQDATVKAALPMQLAFSTAAQTLTAGECSAAVTVETRDTLGNPSPVPAAESLALSASPAAGVALFAGAGCSGTPVSTLPLAAGASAATFSFRGTAAGPLTLRAASPAVGSATQAETVRPRPPERLAFETSPRSAAAGACSEPVTIRSEDAHGNPSPVTAATTIALTASPATGFVFYADDACTVAVASVTLAAGGGPVTVRFKGAAAGAVTVTAAAAGLTSADQVERVGLGGPDHLAFTSPAQRLGAGACSAAVELEARDAVGPAAAPGALSVSLAASPSAGVSFFAGAGCAGAPVSAVSLAAGSSAVTFSFRATASGTVTLTAAAPGLSPTPTQDQTIVPGALDHLDWAAVPSPQASEVPFAVSVTARDAWGNVASSFTGTAALSVSAGAVTCSSSCTSGTVTGGFTAGAWMGSVAVSPQGRSVTLVATAGSATGTSAPFDVNGPATRSPPTARLTVTPTVLISGNEVQLDASASSDHQTPARLLSVSWDFEATAASMDRTTAPPWTTWSTAKTAAHAYINNGSAPIVYQPRIAVADLAPGSAGGPDLGYASATVVVLPNGNGHCTVDTASDVDDGATSCHAQGGDGKLSLREAIRIANGASSPVAVDFAGPMTIAVSGTLTVSRPLFLVAQPGVALDGGTLSIRASGVLVAGLELSRQASPVVVQAGGDATFRDVHLHDGAGLVVRGRARLDRVRMSGCAGTCVEVDDPGAWLALFNSELRGSGSNTGLALTSCAGEPWSPSTLASPFQPYNGSVLVAGTVFRGFARAVESHCAAAVLTNDTFVGNDIGVHGIGAALLDGIFSGQTASAVSASGCPGFARSGRHVVWQNASDGCLASEVAPPADGGTFSADPLYVAPASGDYRIQRDSPARDTGSAASTVELDGAGPGRFLGADADRGGRETY